MTVLPTASLPLSSAARSATERHEVMNTVIHSALVRDIDRSVMLLADGPDARHRRALAGHLHFLLDQLHHHHSVEMDLIWPAVLVRRPDLTPVVAPSALEHDRLVSACHAVRDTATTWSYDGSEARRLEVLAAVRDLRTALSEQLEHEESTVMPVVCAALAPPDWSPIDTGMKDDGTVAEQARTVLWLLDSLDARRAGIVRSTLPTPLRWVLGRVYGPREARRSELLWG